MGARHAFPAALALWLGLVLAGPSTGGAPLVAATLSLVLLARRRAGPATLVLALFAAGLARGAAGQARLESARLPAGGTEPGVWRLVARLESPPLREADAPAANARVLAASPPLVRDTRLRLRLPPGSQAEWGDTVECLARLESPSTPRSPGAYDGALAATAAGSSGTGRAFTALVRPARDGASLPIRMAMRVRRALERALGRALSPEARELATPLLLGDRSGMATDTDAALRASGLVHLLALSGLHVTWLAGVARALVAIAGGGPVARAVGGALAALGYALVAGPIPSLARAVAAEAVAALAAARERAVHPLQSLGLAALVLLAARPGWAFDLGFQLSCAATFGLVALGGPLSTRAERPPRLVRSILSALALTAGAQLAALPWLLARFHALPWTTLLANLVAVPVSEGLLASAALAALCEVIVPGSDRVWSSACEALAAMLQALIARSGAWPGALLATGPGGGLVVLAIAAAVLVALSLERPRALDSRGRGEAARVLSGVIACALSVALLVSLAGVRALSPSAGRWWLVALDVGQGDAIAIGTSSGWWLVDAGPRSPRWDAGEGTVLPFFRWAGARSLQAVCATHDDGDHTGGLDAIRRGIPVRVWFGPAQVPGVPGPGGRFGLAPLAGGDSLALAPGARVLWPPRTGPQDLAVASRGDNAASLVLELGRHGARALLTADADSLTEACLDTRSKPAILKAGHHGSGSSSGATFLGRLQPARAIISCGARNPYGHPQAGALARLEASGAHVDRTDREGTLWYELSDSGMVRLDWRTNEPLRGKAGSVRSAGSAGAGRAH